jgi:hypothetical protein
VQMHLVELFEIPTLQYTTFINISLICQVNF